jgi:chromosome segregation ATPase
LALEQAQAELQQEQEIANELKERLLNAEDKLEFEQMRFKKEKEELTERIEAEQTKLSNLSNRFEQEKKQFQKEKSEFEQKIERESSRVEEAQTKLERVESEFRKSQRDLKDEISSQAKKLREIDAQLTSEQLLRKEERVDLERRLAEETAKLQVAEKQYENDRRLFERVKADLEERIRVEKTRVGVLNKQLEVEQKRYADTKDRLESTIAKEKARLADVQTQLEQEQTQFEKEKAILKEKLEEGERIRKLKARQMHDRYNTIRQEMTELYEGAKRDARKERNSLTTKYTTQINDLTGTIQRLETDLTGAREAADTMKDQIESYELEKRKFIEERQRMEKSFTDEIAKKNTVIVGLRQHVDVLKQEVRDREETIEQYESSFRKILGLGRDLSKKRLAKTGSKLRNIVRRKKDKI